MLGLFGLLIGFLASVMPGPINVLAISQAMRHGFWKSLAVGLTATLFDMLYCYAALIATTLFYSTLDRSSGWLRLVSIVVVAAVGIHLLRHARGLDSIAVAPPREARHLGLIIMTSLLYVSSPTLAAFWIAVAGFLSAHGLAAQSGVRPYVFSVCVGIGSMIWYLSIARFAPKLQTNLGLKLFKIILTILALLMFGLAILASVRLFVGLL